MKALVIFDSVYGNTEKIAMAIGNAIASETIVLRVGEVNPQELKTIDILIVGSPTHGGRPTQAIQDFLDKALAPAINGKKVARIRYKIFEEMGRNIWLRRRKNRRESQNQKWNSHFTTRTFLRRREKGPLKKGELERAANWAKQFTK